jgi:hypothetical protein
MLLLLMLLMVVMVVLVFIGAVELGQGGSVAIQRRWTHPCAAAA